MNYYKKVYTINVILLILITKLKILNFKNKKEKEEIKNPHNTRKGQDSGS